MEMKYINQNDSKQKEAYDYIQQKIEAGEYPPGMLLVERQLCEQIGVSRTPVRGALAELAKGELVTYTPNVGMSVSFITRQDVMEIYELRCALDALAVADFTAHCTDKDIEVLSGIMDKMTAAFRQNDLATLVEQDVLFHRYYCARARNRRLGSLISSMVSQMRRLRLNVIGKVAASKDLFEEHEAIYKAIVARRPQEAAERVKRHFTHTRDYHLQLLDEQEANL